MISVIMSVYNSEHYLREAVDSILNQTYSDFEFIITDDYSTDNSLKILEQYAEKDNRIILYKNIENIGLTKSLNKMLEIAKGNYIARMDADDISLPKRFEIQFSFMEKNIDIGVCGSNIRYFGNTNAKTKHPLKHDEIKVGLLFKNIVMHPSVFIRKSVIDEFIFKYDESYKIIQDYDLWCRMINFTKFENLEEILIDYRFQDMNITNSHKFEYKIDLLRKIFEKQIISLNVENKEYHNILFDSLIIEKEIKIFNDIKKLEIILQKIIDLNVISNVYNYIEFEKKISEHWFNLCTRNTKFGIRIVITYFMSNLNNSIFTNLRFKLKFIFKSLIKYKRV